MFKKIKAKIAQMNAQTVSPDVSHFNDDLAEQVDWLPLKGGGTNIKTHTLQKENYNRYSFKPTISSLLFAGVFAVVGLAIPFVFIASGSEGQGLLSGENLAIVGFGSIFAGVGLFMGFRFLKPIVFDKSVGYFWRGWKEPQMYKSDNPKDAIRISEIHAFQILSEYIRSDKSSYYSYELNIILRDGSRHNVIDHGSLDAVRNDAKALSEFLGKPVWDMAGR